MKHGHAKAGKQAPEYNAWRHMIARCTNPNDPRYSSYGGKGVKVCAAWRNDYAAFLRDIGRRPTPQHTLERTNVYGHYEPENCVWLHRSEQARNQRRTKLTPEGAEMIREMLGQGFTQQAIAETMGVDQTTVSLVKRGKVWRTNEGGQIQ
jgi:predicted DNA-binding protein (UPF0251 family)